MKSSFRPALEALEDRFLPSVAPMQSLGSLVSADVQHSLLHVQIIDNKIQIAGTQAGIHLDQQALTLLHGQMAASVQSNLEADQAALSALMQHSTVLANEDTSTDASTFPLLRAVFPAAQ
jgi:hypothetical protein